MVGHVELFNPVVKELQHLIGETSLRSLRFKRLGFVDDASRLYHDVVQDLMLHDLSIANQIVDPGHQLKERVVFSFGRQDTTANPDPAEAIVDYGNGVDAHFRASRAFTGGKVRRIEVETDEGVYDADLLSKQITKRTGGEGSIATNGTYVQDLRTTSFFARENRQPLELEQIHFLKSIRGITTPEAANVALTDAIRILNITDEILQKLAR
jgi:predicted dehydrogenase